MNSDSKSSPPGSSPGLGQPRPPRQRRSRATRDRLLAAGKRLVEAADFDAVSIADIATAANCSVGAFYVRYENKDAFFRSLVADMLGEQHETLEALHRNTPDAAIVDGTVENVLAAFRNHAGLIRSALRKGMEDPSVWEPIRAHGQDATDRLVARVGAIVGRALLPEEEARIRFAAQVLYGTLINALLHRPGPLLLDGETIERELVRVFRLTMALPGI